MALTLSSLRNGSLSKKQEISNEELFKLLQTELAPKPQANPLERLMAVPSALGSIPDVIYRMQNEGVNPLEAYAQNLGQGFKTAFLGEKAEREQKTTSDLLKQSGVFAGDDMGSNIARGVAGFAGDVLLDPTTYLSFGTVGLGKAAAKGVTKELASKAGVNFGKDVAKELTERIAKNGVKSGVEFLGTKGLVQEGKLLAGLGKSIKPTKALNILGKEVTRDQRAVKAVEAFTNPLGLVAGTAWQGAQKLAPEVIGGIEETLAKVFKPGAYYDKKGLGQAYEGIKNFSREMVSKEREAGDQFGYLAKQIAGLPEDQRNAFGKIIEEGNLPNGSPPELSELINKVASVTQQTGKELKGRGLLATSFTPQTPTLNALGKNSKFGFERLLSDTQVERLSQVGIDSPEKLVEFSKRVGSHKRPFTEEIVESISEWTPSRLDAGKHPEVRKITQQMGAFIEADPMKKRILNEYKLFKAEAAQLGLTPEQYKLSLITQHGEDAVAGFVDVVDKYDSLIKEPLTQLLEKKKSMITQLQQLGKEVTKKEVPVSKPGLTAYEELVKTLGITPTKFDDIVRKAQGAVNEFKKATPYEEIERYFPRDVLGFTEDFIKNKFGDLSSDVLTHPTAIKDLEEKGMITTGTLTELLTARPELSPSVKGLRQPGKYLEGADLQRTFKTMLEGEQAGVVYNKNAAEVFLKNQFKSKKAIAAYDFASKLPELTSDTGERLFYKADEAKQLFGDKIPIGYKEFEIDNVGKFVAPVEAHDMLKNYTKEFFGDEGMNQAVNMYDKMLSTWKASVTGLGPGFIGYNMRNAIGDMTNMLLNGFRNPANIKVGFNVVGFSKTMREQGRDIALKKYGSQVAEIYDQALSKGILGSMGQIEEEVGGAISGFEKIDKSLKGQAQGAAQKVGDAWKEVATARGFFPAREEAFKIAMFADSYARNKDWKKAAQDTFLSNFDYNDLSATEKNVLRRVIPFYSYLRKNLEFQLTNFASNPGRYTTLQHFTENVRKNFGAQLTEEEMATLPDWMKNSLGFTLGKDGRDVTMLTGFGLPTDALNETLGGDQGFGVGTLQNILGSLSPVIKTPIEVGTGKNIFTGKDIIDENYGGRYEKFPEPIKRLLGYREEEITKKDGSKYTKQTVDPIANYIMSTAPFLSPSATMFKRSAEVPDNPLNILNILSGGRVYTRNLDQEEDARARERMELIKQFLLRNGYGGKYESFNLTDQSKKELLERLGK
jgi:hypothetical protein